MKKNAILLIFVIILISQISCKNEDLGSTDSNDFVGFTDSEILIGTSVPLTGHASFLGTQLTKGSLTLLKEINDKGGIHGRTIKMVILDDQYEPANTSENTTTLIKEKKVFILFDYVGTPTSKQIIRIVNKEKVPVLGLFTGAEFLRNPLQPYIFNIRASYFKEVENIVDQWIDKKKKRIAVFLQDDAFGYAVLAGTELALARHNLEVVGKGKFKRGELPENEAVESVVSSTPDAIVMVGTSKSLATFVKMTKDAGLKGADYHTVSFVGSGAFARDLLSFGEGTEKNVYVTQVVPSPYNTENKTVNEFRRLFKKHYPEEQPNYVAMEGFINAKILIEALDRCGSDLNRYKFMKILEKMADYNAGTGLPSKISPQNHSFFQKVYLSTIKNGKFEVIK